MNKFMIFVFLAIGGIFASCSNDKNEEFWFGIPEIHIFDKFNVDVYRGDSLLFISHRPFMVQSMYVTRDNTYQKPRSETEEHLLTLLYGIKRDMTELNFQPQHGELQWLSMDVPNDSTLILKVDKNYWGRYRRISIDCFCPDIIPDDVIGNVGISLVLNLKN